MAKNILRKRSSGRKTPSRKASPLRRKHNRLERLIHGDAWRESLEEPEIDLSAFPSVAAR